MNNQDYEKAKRECWEHIKFALRAPNTDRKTFDFIFDRAYALGKEKETITQEEIEKASLKYILNRQQARHDAKREEEASLSDFDNTLKAWDAFDMAQAYEDGVNFALGKQERDAEVEEMLTVSRKQIDALQGEIFKAIMDAHDADDWQDAAHYILDVMPRSFAALFGSKCLPDEACNVASSEPKPAEPEKESRNLSQKTAICDKEFDNILKDSFPKGLRLNIAAQLTCAMIPKYQDNGDGHGLSVLNEKDMIKCAYRLAGALIKEAEKGGPK